MCTVFCWEKNLYTLGEQCSIIFVFEKNPFVFGFGEQLDNGSPLLPLVPPCSLCLLEDFCVSLPDHELLDKPWS